MCIRDDEFWNAYDNTLKQAESRQEWIKLEMQRQFTTDNSNFNIEHLEANENFLDQKYLLVIWELWNMT